MWLLDQWAERHILDAQRKGELDNLPGSGEPCLWMTTRMCQLSYAQVIDYSKCGLFTSRT